jgi:hypothetical protein
VDEEEDAARDTPMCTGDERDGKRARQMGDDDEADVELAPAGLGATKAPAYGSVAERAKYASPPLALALLPLSAELSLFSRSP